MNIHPPGSRVSDVVIVEACQELASNIGVGQSIIDTENGRRESSKKERGEYAGRGREHDEQVTSRLRGKRRKLEANDPEFLLLFYCVSVPQVNARTATVLSSLAEFD